MQKACHVLRSRKPKDKEAAPSGLFYLVLLSLGAPEDLRACMPHQYRLTSRSGGLDELTEAAIEQVRGEAVEIV